MMMVPLDLRDVILGRRSFCGSSSFREAVEDEEELSCGFAGSAMLGTAEADMLKLIFLFVWLASVFVDDSFFSFKEGRIDRKKERRLRSRRGRAER